MRKTLITSITAGTMALFLLSACAKDGNDSESTNEPVTAKEKTVAEAVDHAGSIMDQPVNFSTPEEVEKSLQKVREQEGDKALKNLESAMKFVLYYDLSLKGDKENLYRKLDGKTPDQIIAMMER
jgi:hypothetical protein